MQPSNNNNIYGNSPASSIETRSSQNQHPNFPRPSQQEEHIPFHEMPFAEVTDLTDICGAYIAPWITVIENERAHGGEGAPLQTMRLAIRETQRQLNTIPEERLELRSQLEGLLGRIQRLERIEVEQEYVRIFGNIDGFTIGGADMRDGRGFVNAQQLPVEEPPQPRPLEEGELFRIDGFEAAEADMRAAREAIAAAEANGRAARDVIAAAEANMRAARELLNQFPRP